MNKYTVIYENRWMAGSHMHQLTKIARFKVKPNETMQDALIRIKLVDSAVFIFKGWSLLEGEDDDKNFRVT
jgi:hypothetical protein